MSQNESSPAVESVEYSPIEVPSYDGPAAGVVEYRAATRPETGPMVFGDDDWTGVFIRGDNSAHYVRALHDLLMQYEGALGAAGVDFKAFGGIQRSVVDGLLSDLASSRHGETGAHDERGVPKNAQRLRSFAECRATTPPTRATTPDDPHVDLDGFPVSMKEMEERHVLRVLVAVKGNKSKAARVLGLDRRTLYRKLEKYTKKASG